jgi:hypothetical protein
MSTYSFLDCNAGIVGPGGAINLAADAGAAEEGITIVPVEAKNIMQIGAGGQGQHSLVAGEASTVTVNLLKTSPVNALLMAMYNYQTSSSVLHGKNTIAITDLGRGDLITLSKVAFQKAPDLGYAKEAGMNAWVFDAIFTNRILGVGTPEL